MGSDDEKVLTQADVDALVALVPSKPRATVSDTQQLQIEEIGSPVPDETVAIEIPPDEASPIPQSSSPELESIQKSLADMVIQVTNLTDAVRRIEVLEKKTEQIAKSVSQSPNTITQSLELRIDELQSQLQSFYQKVHNKHELREDFQCSHCKSKATVAFYAKCTTCGKEKWFGWWPAKKPAK
ncbi:MAG: hypothetical protein JW967_11685 [Dehalococcoidales bacterium]|nr:hypothetical protein [Dehalococcoidales bacterium]